MSCADFDLRDYFLNELPEAERQRTARHVVACSGCAGELESLRHLRFALDALPAVDPPQRIGFVSDRVFEPSRARRVWNSLWNSAPRLGFASAALLAPGMVLFALRPVPQLVVASPAPVYSASAAADLAPRVGPLIDRAVRQAVLATEARLEKHTEAQLAALERKHEAQQRALLQNVAEYFTMPQKRAMMMRAASLTYGGDVQ